jgi:hypothetical protein
VVIGVVLGCVVGVERTDRSAARVPGVALSDLAKLAIWICDCVSTEGAGVSSECPQAGLAGIASADAAAAVGGGRQLMAAAHISYPSWS